ncbi:MAG TPA: hypothetical protein VGP48_09775 [Stellaceae bacterium]|jgi:hypothetical protein|nr:hypothetical protein [Stellaceae bacterium]
MPLSRLISQHGRNHPGLMPADAFAPLPPATHNYPLLGFKDIYATVGAIGLRLAERARGLAGAPVRIRGYMAPPDLERGDFFVLTRAPIVTCPFCDPGTSWPDDVVLALLERDSAFVDPAMAIEVVGELELGAKLDPCTGAIRRVRLRDARWQPLSP